MLYDGGIGQHSDSACAGSRSSRNAIFWTALPPFQSATVGGHFCFAEAAGAIAPSEAKLEMASSQNLRSGSPTGQSWSTNALDRSPSTACTLSQEGENETDRFAIC